MKKSSSSEYNQNSKLDEEWTKDGPVRVPSPTGIRASARSKKNLAYDRYEQDKDDLYLRKTRGYVDECISSL
jgi:hypothetical protein